LRIDSISFSEASPSTSSVNTSIRPAPNPAIPPIMAPPIAPTAFPITGTTVPKVAPIAAPETAQLAPLIKSPVSSESQESNPSSSSLFLAKSVKFAFSSAVFALCAVKLLLASSLSRLLNSCSLAYSNLPGVNSINPSSSYL
jgi:hypothetical protein